MIVFGSVWIGVGVVFRAFSLGVKPPIYGRFDPE